MSWRARLGIIVPSVNKTMEPELYSIVPKGVSLHFSRITQREDTIEELQRMVEGIHRAVSELADAEVNLLAFGCTSGSLVGGVGYDKELIKRMEDVAHIPAITTSTAVMSALKELEIKNVCVATPYKEELNRKVKEFLESHEYNVLKIKGLGCSGPETADVSIEQVYELAKEVFLPKANGLFISCTDLRTFDILEALECDLNIPVVSSNQATMWMMLRKVGVKEVIRGYGRLLTKI